ncbi:MFS transporter [Streptomyces sp. NPDC096176]|uniref:MFS transporter n=1 Tax=Streptomyces sp. NPDC096176 TaxID=3366079 RepID=UPI0038155F41
MNAKPAAPTTAASAPQGTTVSARSAGLRYGALFGPVVFGVTAAGVALPDVAEALGTTGSATGWVLTAHALALGVGTALFGRLADTKGVRASLLLGSLVLAVGALICLVAPDLGTLVAGRFVLAAGSGAMASGALALSAASAPADRPKVLAGFGATMAFFSAGATLVGGVFTEWLTWRLTLVLPVFSLLAVPLCLRHAARRGSGRPMDLLGASLLTVAATSFLLLIQASALGLPAPLVVGITAALVLGAAGLVWRTRTSPVSFVPRRLVTDSVFLRAAVVGIGVYGGLFAAMYAVPQLLVREHGWSVLAVGVWLLPGAALGALLSRAAGGLTSGNDGGSRLLAAIAGATAGVLAGTLTSGGPAQLIIGASLGFAAFAVTQVVTTALMSQRVEPALRGGAMGLLNLSFFVGGGVGSATVGALAKSMSLSTSLGVIAAFPLVAGLVALTLARRPA